MHKIFVAGSGSWGLAIAKMAAEKGHDVTISCRSEEKAAELARRRENPRLLPGVRLPDSVRVTADYGLAREAELVVIAVPSHAVREICLALQGCLQAGVPLVLLSKGFDREQGDCLLSETVESILPGHPVAALTGPSHAEEVGRKMPTAVVAACADEEISKLVQEIFTTEYFRIYTSTDIISAELGGAMKNIMAIAVGMSDGYGFGDNTKAMLMTRGIAEMSRLGVCLGGEAETFAGLSGIGDLIVTCISQHSRNRRFGLLIGRGMPVQQALKEVGAVVEGYYATGAIHRITQEKGIEMPICNAIYSILYKDVPITQMHALLLDRPNRSEQEP
ncbi:MAG: NAD(P)-dependent glycerol-3-phosphate dehydrogenase [Clostridia bacterium]|nr:NAD(P)-dependent glycerol-3-phosphate dehydrogenase [Clostridia bacterium]